VERAKISQRARGCGPIRVQRIAVLCRTTGERSDSQILWTAAYLR
jgi:hypothetical protein